MTKIWAHRGASRFAPENTVAAFRIALEQGADGFELDVQRSADGVLVVCHDETVDRTSDGSGAIARMTWRELAGLDLSNGMPGWSAIPMPTLAEVLELVIGTDVVINIELKNSVERYPGMEAMVVGLVEEMGLAQQVWYSSFNHLSLVELIDLGVTERVGALYVEQLVRPWEYVSGFGARAMHPEASFLTPGIIAAAHASGVEVHPWTVDDPQRIRALAEAGVDAMITNVPDLAREVLSARDRWEPNT